MLALIVATVVAQAAAVPLEPTPIQRLRWNPKIDLPVTALLGGGWLVSEFAVKRQLAPANCRACGTNDFDESVFALFRPNVGLSGGSVADTASNIGWGVAVAASLGVDALIAWHDDALGGFPVDAALILEATFAAMAVNQTVKFAVGRERPFVARLAQADKSLTAQPEDNNLSFFSGHSTFTMSVAVAAGTIAHLRGYRLAWLGPAIGVPASVIVGVLRIASGKHYFTDVFVGWLVGAGIGFGIPWLFHQPDSTFSLRLVPSPGGVALAGRF